MPLGPRTQLRVLGGFLALAAALGVPRRASASPECIVEVIPERPSPAWQEAIEHARQTLASQSGDCRKIVIEVDSDFATLTFTTVDGRRAVRVLHDPGELSPSLDALVVTLPPPRAPTVPATTAGPPSSPTPGASPPAATQVHALLTGLAGARLAGPGPFLGPTAILGAGVGLEHWELGLVAQWTPVYGVLTDDPTRPVRLAGISAGLAVGKRTRLGKEVTLVTGLSLSAAAQHEGWHTPDPTTGRQLHEDSDRGQALVGAYAATVFPTTARLRFRSSLSADVDATHAGENGPPASGVPALPWWALTLAVGVESEVL